MPEVPTCKNISMLKRYGNENERFSWMYRKQIIDATKCLMPCYFMKYRVIIIFIIVPHLQGVQKKQGQLLTWP